MLTGKDIHASYMRTNDPNEAVWETLSTKRQAEYNDVAARLNQSYIAPLQGLVKELEETLVYCWGNEFPADDVEKLQARVKQLCGDES